MKFRKQTLALAVVTLFISGCTSSLSGDSYSRDEARQAQHVQMGTVVSTRSVQIEGTKSVAGTLTGAALGGVAGNAVGHGNGRKIATVAGVAAGALAGSAIEEGVTRTQGIEVLVKLDDTNVTRAYVQATGTNFYAGQRVRITTTANGTARVNPL